MNTTLQKFKERILARQAMARRGGRLFQKSERDLKRLRTGLVDQLISGRGERLSVAVIQEAYYLPVESGFFQAVWLKFDGPPEAFTEAGLAAIMEKADSILESALRSKCIEMVFRRVGSSYVGFLNYGSGRKEEVRRGLKDCLNQLKSQQVLYGPVQFSLAVGRAAENPEELKRSMYEASVIIKERLVRGNGRILDRMPEPSALHERKLLDKYLRNITHAVEVMSLEEAAGAVSELSSAAREVREVRGFEIRELIHSCASLFSAAWSLVDVRRLCRNLTSGVSGAEPWRSSSAFSAGFWRPTWEPSGAGMKTMRTGPSAWRRNIFRIITASPLPWRRSAAT